MRDLLPLRLEKLEATLAAAVSLREATSSQPATATLLRVTSAPLFTIYSMLYAASASVWRGWAVRAALLAQPPRETSGRAHHHANSVEPHEKSVREGDRKGHIQYYGYSAPERNNDQLQTPVLSSLFARSGEDFELGELPSTESLVLTTGDLALVRQRRIAGGAARCGAVRCGAAR